MTHDELDRVLREQFGKIQLVAGAMCGIIYIYILLTVLVTLYLDFKGALLPAMGSVWRSVVFGGSVLILGVILAINRYWLAVDRMIKLDLAASFQRYSNAVLVRLALGQLPLIGAIFLFLTVHDWLDLALLFVLALLYSVVFFPRFNEWARRSGYDQRRSAS